MFRSLLTACLCLLAAASHAADGKRVALVVGAGAYKNAPQLDNPPRDARAVAASLQRLGFDTNLVIDPDRPALEQAVRALGDKSRNAEAAVFFYAGHGLESGGHNYILPVGAKLASPRDLPFETLDLDLVLASADGGAKTLLIFLDACRDNPFLRNLSGAGRGVGTRGGLAAPAADVSGTLIAFSTAPGRTADDGDGQNSPFTKALLHQIETPGLEVRQMLGRVRGEVRQATNGQQTPWESSALEGEFYFHPATASLPVPRPAPPRPVAAPPPAAGRTTNAAPPATPEATASRCVVDHVSGIRTRPGGAETTMRTVGDGRGCSFRIFTKLAERVGFESLVAATPPANGILTFVQNTRITYTPAAGFTGKDRFVVNTVPKGRVVVNVEVRAPVVAKD
jgi:hypothetical protein